MPLPNVLDSLTSQESNLSPEDQSGDVNVTIRKFKYEEFEQYAQRRRSTEIVVDNTLLKVSNKANDATTLYGAGKVIISPVDIFQLGKRKGDDDVIYIGPADKKPKAASDKRAVGSDWLSPASFCSSIEDSPVTNLSTAGANRFLGASNQAPLYVSGLKPNLTLSSTQSISSALQNITKADKKPDKLTTSSAKVTIPLEKANSKSESNEYCIFQHDSFVETVAPISFLIPSPTGADVNQDGYLTDCPISLHSESCNANEKLCSDNVPEQNFKSIYVSLDDLNNSNVVEMTTLTPLETVSILVKSENHNVSASKLSEDSSAVTDLLAGESNLSGENVSSSNLTALYYPPGSSRPCKDLSKILNKMPITKSEASALDNKSVPCPYKEFGCTKTYDIKTSLSVHVRNACRFSSRNAFECAACKHECETKEDMLEHCANHQWSLELQNTLQSEMKALAEPEMANITETTRTRKSKTKAGGMMKNVPAPLLPYSKPGQMINHPNCKDILKLMPTKKAEKADCPLLVKCPYEGCEKSYDLKASMRAHLKVCAAARRQDYECDYCGHHTNTERSMHLHCQKEHDWTITTDVLLIGDDSEDDGDASFIANETEDVNYSDSGESLPVSRPTRQKKKTKVDSGNKSVVKEVDINEDSLTKYGPKMTELIGKLRNHSLDEQVQMHSKQMVSTKPIFEDWLPNRKCWKQLSLKESTFYLPAEEQSAHFVFDSAEQEINKLHKFDAILNPETGHSTVFTGGPVWALAWCCQPNVKTEYLAVYCQNQFVSTPHCIVNAASGPGALQLWEVNVRNDRLKCPPRLLYCIALEEGCVWKIQWCPVGAYQVQAIGNGDTMSRLGLVALATSGGVVTIYALPHPSAVVKEPLSSDIAVFKVPPVAKLSPVYDGPCEYNCLCLSWASANQCKLLAAGFGNGAICVWDLTTKSKLLCCDDGYTFNISPFLQWKCHAQPVQNLEFCPTSDNYLITTASIERTAKVWDLKNIKAPLEIFNRLSCKNVCWISGYPTWMLSGDDCSLGSHQTQSSTWVENGYYCKTQTSCLSLQSSVKDMSYSPWLHCVVYACSSGELLANPMPNNAPSKSKKVTEDRRMCFWSMSSDLPTSSGSTSSSSGAELVICMKDVNLKTTQDLKKVHKCKSAAATESENLLAIPNHCELNRCAWNSNPGNASWCAFGSAGGLVQLINVAALYSKNRLRKS